MNAFFLHSSNGRELKDGRRGTLVECGEHRALAQLPLPAGFTPLTGATLAAIRAAHGITPAVPKPVPVPATITPSQLRLQLLADGKSADAVLAVIAQLPESVKAQAGVMWEYSLEYRRAHPLVIQLAGALGYDTSEKLDAFFIAAAAR